MSDPTMTEAADVARQRAVEANDADATRALHAIATAAQLLAEVEDVIRVAVPSHADHLPTVAACLHDTACDVAGHYRQTEAA